MVSGIAIIPTPTPIVIPPSPVPTIPPTIAGLPLINYFNANPPFITPGDASTLSWSISNATSVAIDQGIGSVGLVGTTPVSPGVTTDYTLTATNAYGLYTATLTVLVTAVPPPSGLPDLVIQDVSHSGAIISYTIRNQGTATSGPSTSELVIDGGVKAYDSVGSLNAGASAIRNFSAYSYACAGTSDSISVRADKDNTVAESNEANNLLSKSWTCMVIMPTLIPTLIPTFIKPDLIVQDIYQTSDKIYFVVKNQGGSSSAACTAKLYVSGSYKESGAVPIITAGSSVNLKFSYDYDCIFPTPKTVMVEVDSGNTNSESNETNNKYSETVLCD